MRRHNYPLARHEAPAGARWPRVWVLISTGVYSLIRETQGEPLMRDIGKFGAAE